MRILILLLAALPAWTQTAQAMETEAGEPAALMRIWQQGIDGLDSAPVLERLDLESLLGTGIQEGLPLLNKSVRSGELRLSPPLALALSALNSGNEEMRAVALRFVSVEAGKFIAYGVDSGSFAGKPLPAAELTRLDGGIFSQFGTAPARRKVFSATKVLKQEGKNALISTNLIDEGNGRSYALELDLQKREAGWIVIGVHNILELYTELLRSSKAD
jgi:hypothetical protein